MLIHLKTEENYSKVEKLFNQIRKTSKPKIVTWKDIRFDIPNVYEDMRASGNGYAEGLMQFSNSKPWYPMGQEAFMKSIEDGIQPLALTHDDRIRLGDSGDNRFFHASKLRWLIDEWKENGWYSYPQACVQPNGKLWFHPGMIRQFAMLYGEMYKQKIVLWDCWDNKEFFPNIPILEFEEYRNIFSVKRSQWIDTKGMDGTSMQHFGAKPILEWHVDEDRPNFYLTARRYQEEIFNYKKPKIYGKIGDGKYAPCFEWEDDNHNQCLEIHMKEGITFDKSSLKYIFQIPFEDKEWECEEFFIRKTF